MPRPARCCAMRAGMRPARERCRSSAGLRHLPVARELLRLRLRRAAKIAAERWAGAALGGGLAGVAAGAIGGLILAAAPGSAGDSRDCAGAGGRRRGVRRARRRRRRSGSLIRRGQRAIAARPRPDFSRRARWRRRRSGGRAAGAVGSRRARRPRPRHWRRAGGGRHRGSRRSRLRHRDSSH